MEKRWGRQIIIKGEKKTREKFFLPLFPEEKSFQERPSYVIIVKIRQLKKKLSTVSGNFIIVDVGWWIGFFLLLLFLSLERGKKTEAHTRAKSDDRTTSRTTSSIPSPTRLPTDGHHHHLFPCLFLSSFPSGVWSVGWVSISPIAIWQQLGNGMSSFFSSSFVCRCCCCTPKINI